MFGLVILFGFLLRLYRFDSPIADWHSWRQADTSAVSRNFIKYGFDFFRPRFDDLSNVASGKDNPQGYRFVEFPIYNFFQAGFYRLFGGFTLEEWGRLVSIFSSLSLAVFIYLLLKKYSGWQMGILGMFFFLLLPYSIYYSRSILPEMMAAMAIIGGIYFFDQWIEKSNSQFSPSYNKLGIFNLKFLLTLVFASGAFLLKPYTIFFTLPIIYLAFKKFGFGIFKRIDLWIFAILSILPLLLWRVWMQNFPEGIPDYKWLFNAGDIRFKGAFFYWLFAQRLSTLILGYFGIALFFLGILKKSSDDNYGFFSSFLISALLYLFTIAAGNVRHDYYQVLIIPSVAIFLARGTASFLSISNRKNNFMNYFLLLFIVLGMFAFSWYHVRDYFNINNQYIVIAGRKADEILPKNAKVIAPYDGNTSFLYQTNRQGWPVFQKPIEDLIKMGADYLVLPSPSKSDFEGFGKMFEPVASSSDFLILKLR